MCKNFRKCGSCFRYLEDWRDAVAKGLKSYKHHSLADIKQKPRKGIKCICSSVHKKDRPRANDKGCGLHRYRWTWNLEQWWKWDFKYKLERLFCIYIRCPIGGLRKPVPLKWEDSFDGMCDRIIPDSEPQCPHCGEMPYSYTQCVFCGQRFIQDAKTKEYSEPPEKEVMDCFVCGGKDTMKGYRAKINGHFHGECEKCGARVMQ